MDVAAMGQSPLPIPASAPAPAPTTAPPPASIRERTVYAAGGGRKFAFSFIFLILLPFFISLPPMLFWRISQGHWQGTLGLVVLAIGFTFIMFLLFIEVMHSLMTRVELGGTSVKMTLPSGRGPTPIVRYRTSRHPVRPDQGGRDAARDLRRVGRPGSAAGRPPRPQGRQRREARLRQRGQ